MGNSQCNFKKVVQIGLVVARPLRSNKFTLLAVRGVEVDINLQMLDVIAY